jgi:hypothetical protein
LDKSKNTLSIPAIYFLFSTRSFNLKHKGWYKLYPSPIRKPRQLRVSLLQPLKILSWIIGIR